MGAVAALTVIGLPSISFGIAAVIWAPRQTATLDVASMQWLSWAGYGCLALGGATIVALSVILLKTRNSSR